MNQCSICSAPIAGHGHNAEPVSEGRCCDLCNYTAVVPARLTDVLTALSTNDALRDLSTIALLDVLPALRPLTAPPTKALLNDPTPLLRASDTESEVKEGTEETGDYTVGSAR